MSATTKNGPMAAKTTPKTMSSRLLTMKFMQRGAASSPAASVATPTTPATASSDGSSKRRKTSHADTVNSPGTPLYDQKALQAAIVDEDRKRQIAIEKRAQELGDSHWVLESASFEPAASGKNTASDEPKRSLNVVQVGFAQIDNSRSVATFDGDDESTEGPKGNFLRFNMKKDRSKPETKADDDDDDDESSSGSGSDDSGSETGEVVEDHRGRKSQDRGRRETLTPDQRKRARSNISRRSDKERNKAQELAGKRRMKEVKSTRLMSISSGGNASFGAPRTPSGKCYNCGKEGHFANKCPNRQ